MKLPRLLPVLACLCAVVSAAIPRPIKVGADGRYLVTDDGRPFFWLGDTAWELFHRLNREEADRYLRNRAALGFTVIQAVALAELDGLKDPNAYGHLPLVDNDPARPRVVEGPDNDYWDHVDWIVKRANELGLHVGFLPTWGDKWHRAWGGGPEIFDATNAAIYGEWIGRRYREARVVWILGGDRPFEKARLMAQKDILRAMARGLRAGDGGAHLITFHPNGGAGSADELHGEDWLDFNMRQNGHVAEFTGRYDRTRFDYERVPTKPVLDAEPIYEGHPVSFAADKFGHSIAADVRRPLYWDLFNGACGHTYGHHSVWQMWAPPRQPINNPLMPWTEALSEPGAAQMRHAKALLLSRPYFGRVPDDAVIVVDRVPTSVPGAGRYRFAATRDVSGAYAMVYVPAGRAFRARMDKVAGPGVKAWWFNPRDGGATAISTYPNTGERTFTPPTPGEATDWVLVLDQASRNFPPPGSRPWKP